MKNNSQNIQTHFESKTKIFKFKTKYELKKKTLNIQT